MVFLIFPWLAMLAAFMSTFLAVRHTRRDEEQGAPNSSRRRPPARTLPVVATADPRAHRELRSSARSRHSRSSRSASDADGRGGRRASPSARSASPSSASGSSPAQLMRTSRGANSLAVWVLVVTFLLAGIGNALGTPSDDLQRMESSWLTWLSPFGWGENTRAFADDNLWPACSRSRFGLVLAGVAVALQSRGTSAESFVPERLGRADAAAALSTPTGSGVAPDRGAILGWAVGGLLVGHARRPRSPRSSTRSAPRTRRSRTILAQIAGSQAASSRRPSRSSSRCSGSSRPAPRCRSCAAPGRRRRTAPPSRCCPRPSAGCAGSWTTSSSPSSPIVLVVAAAVGGRRPRPRLAGRRLGPHARRSSSPASGRWPRHPSSSS